MSRGQLEGEEICSQFASRLFPLAVAVSKPSLPATAPPDGDVFLIGDIANAYEASDVLGACVSRQAFEMHQYARVQRQVETVVADRVGFVFSWLHHGEYMHFRTSRVTDGVFCLNVSDFYIEVHFRISWVRVTDRVLLLWFGDLGAPVADGDLEGTSTGATSGASLSLGVGGSLAVEGAATTGDLRGVRRRRRTLTTAQDSFVRNVLKQAIVTRTVLQTRTQ